MPERVNCNVPCVSVIMPVYNAGKYLRDAVESVLAQSFRDFELLLVDDGATDDSGMVCDEYAARDGRVRVRHGRNGGICASRNVGLSIARGKWLAFCDHDDFCEPGWLDALVSAVDGTDLCVAKCGFSAYERDELGNTRFKSFCANRQDCIWSVEQFIGADGYRLYLDLSRVLWDGLYRHDFWNTNGFRFDESFKFGGEDCLLAIDILKAAGCGAWIGRSLYRHYTNAGVSTSASYHPELLEQYLAIARREQHVFGFDSFQERYESFRRWSIGAFVNVLTVRGSTSNISDKAFWLQKYYDMLVGRDTPPDLKGFGLARRLGIWLLRHAFSRVYALLRSAV